MAAFLDHRLDQHRLAARRQFKFLSRGKMHRGLGHVASLLDQGTVGEVVGEEPFDLGFKSRFAIMTKHFQGFVLLF